MDFDVSEKFQRENILLLAVLPPVVYWLLCGIINILGWDTKHPKSSVSKSHVAQRIVLLHFLSTIAMIADFTYLRNGTGTLRWWFLPYGIFAMDTAEYIVHRIQHIPVIYRHSHKAHHQMTVPWSYGALYNSFGEIAITIPIVSLFMSPLGWLEYIIIQTISYVATIIQHCNPNSLHMLHHEGGTQYNFQQPFFYYWDYIFGTLKVPNGVYHRYGFHV